MGCILAINDQPTDLYTDFIIMLAYEVQSSTHSIQQGQEAKAPSGCRGTKVAS